MGNLGYALEYEIENFFLFLENKKREDSVLERSHRVSFSGAMRGEKGDIVGKVPHLGITFLIECKGRYVKTKKDQMIYLERGWLDKIEEEAKSYNYFPLLIISFKRKKEKRLWCVFKKIWIENRLSLDMDSIKELEVREKKNIILSYNIMKNYEILTFKELVFVSFDVLKEWLLYGLQK
ncbi:MAG: hypothetical protein QXL51_00180 [Candidatus Aenigmatarchaeota archaeon]